MGHRSWVRAVKCQLLATSLFIMLLGLSVSILTIITYYGKHFTVIKDVSLEKNAYYRTFHSVVLYTGMCLSLILMVASLLSIVATVRELERGMAVGFFCFAIVFCVSVQATYWTVTNSALFLCCGKRSPFGEESNIENEMCQSKMVDSAKEDCLQEIQHFLKKHMEFVSILMTITVFFMVYGMILTSFLWYSIHFNNSLDRKGKYILAKQ
ncbi:tetraspanin-32 isoform X2 [Sceloporus undulatus]|uniref:tetraspanin-32 isoform X2 n=1 Tax=Sceloporus undulatus TaxID=8520 RepID=UPI001C4D8941|nr:tetraspanin-32 isoform X2 [Sceloporus undulatus]